MTRIEKPKIGLIGFGVIGKSLASRLSKDLYAPKITDVLVRPCKIESARSSCSSTDIVFHRDSDSLLVSSPDLVVECASHAAASDNLLPILESGIDCLIASVGALADPKVFDRLITAAQTGGAKLHVSAGAVGGIDAISAASQAGLEQVVYTARKPIEAWRGTVAEEMIELDTIKESYLVFEGTAREAVRTYPKNANVAMTIALAGLGADHTNVKIYADPSVKRNVHQIEIRGAFGAMDIVLQNLASPENPKTSFLTVLSLERAIKNRSSTIVI